MEAEEERPAAKPDTSLISWYGNVEYRAPTFSMIIVSEYGKYALIS